MTVAMVAVTARMLSVGDLAANSGQRGLSLAVLLCKGCGQRKVVTALQALTCLTRAPLWTRGGQARKGRVFLHRTSGCSSSLYTRKCSSRPSQDHKGIWNSTRIRSSGLSSRCSRCFHSRLSSTSSTSASRSRASWSSSISNINSSTGSTRSSGNTRYHRIFRSKVCSMGSYSSQTSSEGSSRSACTISRRMIRDSRCRARVQPITCRSKTCTIPGTSPPQSSHLLCSRAAGMTSPAAIRGNQCRIAVFRRSPTYNTE